MKILKILWISIFILSCSNILNAQSDKEASNFMKILLKDLETVLSSDKTVKEKVDNFLPFIDDKFDYYYMCRWSLGNYSRVLKGKNLNEYLKECKDYMMIYYGDIFIKYYNGYNFVVVDSSNDEDNNFTVNVYVNPKKRGNKNQGSILNADWKIEYNQEKDKFFLVDLVLNNISVLAVQRSKFEDIIKSNNNNPKAIIPYLKKVKQDIAKKLS